MKTFKPYISARAFLIALAYLVAGLHAGATFAQNGTQAASAPAMASAPASPKAARQANRALRKRVYAAFAKDKSIDAGDIGVSANNGAVTLSGTVTDAAQIERVVAMASGVQGVQSVKNRLSIKREFGH
jgi:osmotically-inducible protein OsmY